ncbi:MAG: hypothetical protein SV760_05115 [Halobacteria archaeon]|nr:hypothetical protein [Halobacteria archaeon]
MIEEDLEDDETECLSCGSDEFEVEVWGVGDEREEPRAAAVCVGCSARLNIRVTQEDIKEARNS